MKPVAAIPICKLCPFAGHPYKVLDDEEMESLEESIRVCGVLSPLIVRPLEGATDEYEVISGHRRLHAAEKAGLETVPAFIHAVDRDEAAIELVDSNLNREHLLPSEKAFAYKLKMDALSHQGQTCGQVGHKSRDEISETESGRTVQRYIRLTHLIPPLMDMVDAKRIAFSVGVELSFLPESLQKHLVDTIELFDATPSYSQAVRMHKMCDERLFALTEIGIEAIMAEEKPNQREQIRLRRDEFRDFFPDYYTDSDIKSEIITGLEFLHRKRTQDRDER